MAAKPAKPAVGTYLVMNVDALCLFTLDGRTRLASVGASVRIWEPATGDLLRTLPGYGWFTSVVAFTLTGRVLLASGDSDATLRVWDPATGAEHSILRGHTLTGHTGPVNGLSATTVDGQILLATASDDRTVRIWDVDSGACQMVIPVQHQATSVVWGAQAETLIIGLGAGLLAIEVADAGGSRRARG